ncbi:hypothetical protein INS49_002821 [Diaporthe citri]|uniref:uncharacterized protein n=1 Tax=Diaporthe citri TaxID=83186 RepID=UPI001C7F8AD0|nr:uncharacterized protein INS49_002821 [Diaporthe citri]KAG6368608.1 hypothetical protein INS49_002821 [Diaporthe citri]
MQIPYNQYAQPSDQRSPSPYAPSSPYQQQHPPYEAQQQASYGSPGGPPPSYNQYNQYAQPSNAPYPHPSQPSYAGHQSPSYNSQQPTQGYGYNAPAQQQYASPPPSHSPYQQEPPYHPPGPPSQGGYGAAASYLNSDRPGSRPEGEDRGVMGALAGGAAGAYAGHKVNHGFLGALGGAFAGHKLQDAIHDHNKQKKDEYKQSHSPQPSQYAQHSPAPHPPRQHYAGNFSASSTQMNIDGDYDLIASCRRMDGGQRLSSVSLNNCLTNEDGHFRWARGGNFGASARNVRLIDGAGRWKLS